MDNNKIRDWDLKMVRLWKVALGIFGIAVTLFISSIYYSNYRWINQDYRGDALREIDRQLRNAHPGYKPDLIAKVYGQDKKSREICIYEMSKNHVIIDIWTVLYSREIPAPLLHREYTPDYMKIGGAEDLCVYYAAEPPPPHSGYGFRLPPRPDQSLEGPAAQMLPSPHASSAAPWLAPSK